MTAKIIAIGNQKGGVGKTTLTTQLAYYFAIKRNKKVLVVDMDRQANATGALYGWDDEGRALPCPEGVTTMFDLFQKDLPQGIHPTKTKYGIDLIFGRKDQDQSMEDSYSGSKDLIIKTENVFNPRRHLRSKAILENYDYVLIDCNPQNTPALHAPILASHYLICPLNVDSYSLSAVSDMMVMVKKLRDTWSEADCTFLGIVFNNCNGSKSEENEAGRVMAAIDDDQLFNCVINSRPSIRAAAGQNKPIWLMKSSQKATEEMMEFFTEVDRKIAKAERKAKKNQ